MRVLGLKARKLAGIPPKHKLRVLPRTAIQSEVAKADEKKITEEVEFDVPVEEPEKLATPKKPRTKKPKVEEMVVEPEPENNEEKPEE